MSAEPVRRRWDQRAFVVMGVALCGLALPITGLVDHVAGDSTSQGAAQGWAFTHTAIGGLFVAFCVWHALLNRRALLRHVRGRAGFSRLPRREFVAAAVLVGAVLAITVTHALVEG